jgi:hypothetical protein
MPRSFSIQSPATYRAFLAHPSYLCSALLIALLHRSESHLLFFQSPAHSLCVYPGWHPSSAPNFRLLTSAPVSPVESALTENAPVTPLESALTKKTGGWGTLC